MNIQDRELIEMKFTYISGVMQANHDAVMNELGHIKKEEEKTIGRINKIEKETSVMRFFQRRPIILLLMVVGIIALIGSGGVTVILKMLGL